MGTYSDLTSSIAESLMSLGEQLDADFAAQPTPEPPEPTDDIPPIPDRAGHREIWRDEFEDLSTTNWGNPYSGVFKSTAGSKADPDNVYVEDGKLCISSYWDEETHEIRTGGLKSKLCLPGSGGWVETCMRIAPGLSKVAVMLYPKSGWPPEIDYMEIGGRGSDRQSMNATLHYGSTDGSVNKTKGTHDLKADYTSWQIVGVRYGGGKMAWTLDGNDVGDLISDPSAVPTVDMYPIYQTECGPSDYYVDPGSLLEVAWIRACV